MAVDSATRRALPWLLLLCAGALVFGRALGFDFTSYDDSPLLVDHHVRVADPRTALTSFFRDAFAMLGPESRGVFYRPLLWFSYLPDARIGGVHPGVYHATNLLLHLVACGLVNTLLRRMGYDSLLALGLSLLLLLHPALAAAVGWIPGRNDSLLAIFAVLSVLALLRFVERPTARAGGLVLLGVAATLFTKESGVALLAVLPALAWVEAGDRRRELLPRAVALGAGVGAVALVWLLLRHVALGNSPMALASPVHNLPMALVYVGKTFVPVHLSVYPNLADVPRWPGVVGCALLLALAFALRHSLIGRGGVGLLWYAAFLAPTLLVSQDVQGLEHRLYVPLIGLLLCGAELGRRIPRGARGAAASLGLLLLVAAAWTTFRRLPDFSSDVGFWQSATRSSPSSEGAWRTLAWRQFQRGEIQLAEQIVQRALGMRPDEPESHLLLGLALARQGRFAEAEPALREAVALDPDNADGWENLARLEHKLGRPEASAASRRRAEAARAKRGD